jgi:uncharacterized membrane protein YhhN
VTPAQLALTLVAAVSAVLHIRAELRGPQWRIYLCKPLTTTAILGIAWLAPDPAVGGYRELVLAGLAFSLAGDVFLMLPGDYFRSGLTSFLVAHLLYIAAFSEAVGFGAAPLAALPVAVITGVLLRLLWPHLHSERWPVVVYIAVIATMGWQATSQWLGAPSLWAAYAFFGAASFMLSDSALAFNRFRGAFASSPIVILSSYYLAQWLIALSVAR